MPHLKKSSISTLTNSMHCGTYIVKDTHDTWRFLSIQTKHCTMLALIHKILISNYLKVLFQSAIFHATWLTIFSKQQDKSHEILIIWNICHDTSCCVAAVLRYSTFSELLLTANCLAALLSAVLHITQSNISYNLRHINVTWKVAKKKNNSTFRCPCLKSLFWKICH